MMHAGVSLQEAAACMWMDPGALQRTTRREEAGRISFRESYGLISEYILGTRLLMSQVTS